MPKTKPAARRGAGAQPRAEMQGTRSLVMNGEIMLYGVIDSYDDFGDSIRSIDVMGSMIELAAQPRLSVRINSPGGNVMEGLSIYNALRNAGKPVDVHIDAMAASIASVIAMAGDTVTIAETGTVMIHNPWDIAIGDAEDMRTRADEIDRLKAIIIDIYAKKTGLDPNEIDALMTAETFMSAADAVEKGFADELEPGLAIAACAKLTKEQLVRLNESVTARAAHGSTIAALPAPTNRKEQPAMAPDNQPGGAAAVAPSPAPTPIIPPPLAPSLDDVRSEARNDATRIERERVSTIMARVRTAKLPDSFADQLIRDGVTAQDAAVRVVDEWSRTQDQRQDNPPGSVVPAGEIRVTADSVDRWYQGAERGLMIRAGLDKPTDADRGNEYVGLTLVELARSSLNVRNIKSGQMDRMKMVGTAFTVRNAGPGMHSTSDFPSVLGSVAYKAMMRGYTEVDETFPLWTGKGTLTDFRPANRVDMGLFPALDLIVEGGEYKYGTIADTGTMVVLATYGKMFAITRQAIINDDLSYFTRVPQKMGRGAKRTIGNLAYAVVNGNPTMQDGIALFHASHGNLAASGAAISTTSLGVARAAMARQKDEAGIGTAVGVEPKFLLVPPELRDLAIQIITSERVPGDAGQIANPVRGMATVISDSRLTGTAWYLASDPSMVDTIEVDYLDGVEEPFLDQKDGWDTDGTEYKVRIDAGVKALHWRGLYKNPGA